MPYRFPGKYCSSLAFMASPSEVHQVEDYGAYGTYTRRFTLAEYRSVYRLAPCDLTINTGPVVWT